MIKTATGKEFEVVGILPDSFNGVIHIIFTSANEDEITKVFSKKKETKELVYNDSRIERTYEGYTELESVYQTVGHCTIMLKKKA